MNVPTVAGLYWVTVRGEDYIASVEGTAPFLEVEIVDPRLRDQGNTPRFSELDPNSISWIAEVEIPGSETTSDDAKTYEREGSSELLVKCVRKLMDLSCPKCGAPIGVEINLDGKK